MAAQELTALCPALALYVRFGVDSPVALQLITRALRSRDVAVAVARVARDAGVADEDVTDWLGSLPIERWPDAFGARPSDVLDLLDAISDPQADLLRQLLDNQEVQVTLTQQLTVAPVQLVVSRAASGVPLVGLETLDGQQLAVLAGKWQTDLRTVLATGVEVTARLADPSTLIIQRSDV
jgi:hypothetical protein